MPLLQLEAAELHFGTHVILDKVNLTLEAGDRLGLVGRNGAGKTTLFKILAGESMPDDGKRWLQPGTRLSRLEQELPGSEETPVYDLVAGGLAAAGELIARYHALAERAEQVNLDELSAVQAELEAIDGWRLKQRVETVISQLALPADKMLSELSGGWRRRVSLGRALVSDPDILLLDEPTNHLDIPTIQWLEQQLANFRGALVLITHDRRFLQNVVHKIAELDRGQLTVWDGDYRGFLRFREQQLQAEERNNALFDKKLAQEEVWIRQGIKARRTRNEGRVRALETMREQRAQRRQQTGSANFKVEDAALSGKLVAEVQDASFGYADTKLIDHFSTIIQRGDRVGIVGRNGIGKSTLVKLLLGELTPQSGQVRIGTKLEIAYSDQLRGHLDPEANLIDNVCGGQEFIEVNGRRKHAISYLGDFLFTPDRVRTPVKALSGGERNRAILAKLFTRPANLLVLDEPTNDLDIETLELLEEILLDFSGTILLVSHDRDFMDKVVTNLLVMQGNGFIEEQSGSFSDWEARGGRLSLPNTTDGIETPARANESASPSSADSPRPQRRKLSYKEQRELASLPERIDHLEKQQAELQALSQSSDFYQQPQSVIAETLETLTELQSELDALIERWTELEE